MTATTQRQEQPVLLSPEDKARLRKQRRAAAYADAASAGWKVWTVKLFSLAIIDAAAIYAGLALLAGGSTLIAVIVLVATVAINAVYLIPGLLPAKYMTPGLVFLIVYQIVAMVFTAYIAFTNFGSGHNSTKEDAVAALLQQNQQRVEDSASYPVTILERDGELYLLTTDPETGEFVVGSADTPLEAVEGATATGAPGYTTLDFAQIVAQQDAVAELTVPMGDSSSDGYLRTADGSTAYVYTSLLDWDPAADTMTNTETGVVYSDNGDGAFVSPDGEELLPGWQVWVGPENFIRAFAEESIRGPFLAVLVWTFTFAVLAVGTAFFFGLILAIVFNDPRMKSKKYYRVVMILPYAFPGFLSALVWAGLFNKDFGFINNVVLGGAAIPWLSDPWLAKVAILIVNLWLAFPYFFLVCTGALQALPEECLEASKVDGATVMQVFRLIKLPLLLVAVAPLLVSSFAMNFNNFGLIFLLTGGGPQFADASINVGATDLLISMVYKVAFVGAERDYGLASAFSIIIFFLVAGISYLGFRQTKVLEELN
ncbi:MAG: ABC transporter permease subunit [Microbacterium sp.]